MRWFKRNRAAAAPDDGVGPEGASLTSNASVASTPNLATSGTREGWPLPSPQEPCTPLWMVVHCLCKATLKLCGCNALDCRGCQFFLRNRRSMTIYDRMEAVAAKKAAIYTVLTVPEEKRREAADPKTWTRWRREIWKWLKREHGGLFAVERTDPAGKCEKAQAWERIGFDAYLELRKPHTEEETAKLADTIRQAAAFTCSCDHCTKWHPHLNLLWVQRDGWSPYIDADKMRAAWAGILGLAPTVNVFGQVEPAYVEIFTQYAAGDSEGAKSQRWHWYRYIGRTWADWRASVPKHLNVRWLGTYPKAVKDDDELPEVCEKCGATFEQISFGTLEAAATLCRAGPAACRKEIKVRRRIAFIASQAAPYYNPSLEVPA